MILRVSSALGTVTSLPQPRQERIPEGHGETKTVKHWQAASSITALFRQDRERRHLRAVGENVAMREDHSFRLAGAAARKQERRLVVIAGMCELRASVGTHWFGSSHARGDPPGPLRPGHSAAAISAARSRVSSVQWKVGQLGAQRRPVMIVRIPPCRRLDSAAVRPTVKLRFTGTLPAHETARFAMTAPAPGGSTMPTRFSLTVARRRRESTAAAATSCAAVTSRRPAVRSTILTRPGRFSNARRVSGAEMAAAARAAQQTRSR